MTPQRVNSSVPLRLSDAHYKQIAEQAGAAVPLEVCGLLGGVGRTVLAVYEVDNVATDPYTSYYMDPREQVRVLMALEAKGWDLVAIYHSHPPGARTDPSPSDVAQAYYPGVLHVIVSVGVGDECVSLRAFLLDNPEQIVEVPVVVDLSAT